MSRPTAGDAPTPICPYCGRQFATQATLLRHTRDRCEAANSAVRPNYQAFMAGIMLELKTLSAGGVATRPMGAGGCDPAIPEIVGFCLLRIAWTRETLSQARAWLRPLHRETGLQSAFDMTEEKLAQQWGVARLLMIARADCSSAACGLLPQELYQALLRHFAALT
jgi:hypothetical protein